MSHAAALELLREAMAATRADELSRARELLHEATRLDPRNETAWSWLAVVAENSLEATTALERVVALNPHNEKARTSLRHHRLQAGIAAVRSKDIATARRLLRVVVAEEPGNEQGWVWLASVCDTPQEAISHLQRALTINPKNTAARKGIEYFQNKIQKNSGPGDSSMTSGVMRVMSPNASGRFSMPERTPHPTPAPGVDVTTPAPARTILVIDASRTNRKLVGLTVALDGFRVIEAGDAAEAGDRVRENGIPDLIIVDDHLPDMDGYEFCSFLRQSPETSRVPVIMWAGKDGLFDKFRGRVAGIDVFLPKPLNPESLLQAVRAYCPAESGVTV